MEIAQLKILKYYWISVKYFVLARPSFVKQTSGENVVFNILFFGAYCQF